MVRFGFIGAGRIGNTHAGQLKVIDGACVGAVYDINPVAAQKMHDEYGAVICNSPDELASNPNVDVVMVTSPTYVHHEGIFAAMRANKPFLCEKALCREPEIAEKILAAGEKYDKLFTVGFVRRHLKKSKKVKQLIEQGLIGKVRYCNVDLPLGMYRRMPGDWFADFNLCGGVIIDMLAHHVDLANWFFGAPDRVYADSMLMDKNLPLPADYVAAIVTYKNGVICNMNCSWQRFGRSNEMMEIYGETGAIVMDGNTKLTIYPINGEKYEIDPDENIGDAFANSTHGVSEVNVTSGFYWQARSIVDYMNGKKVDMPTVRDAYNSVKIGFAMIESTKTKQVVKL